MLPALFLLAWLAPTSPEWVEISQQHYRKPIHSHNFPKPSDYPRLNDDEQIRPNSYKQDGKVYPNHSITEYNWNHNAYRLPGNVKLADDTIVVENNQENRNVHRMTGSIERVDADTIKSPIQQEMNINSNNQRYGQFKDHPEILPRNKLKDEEAISATIKRVPNIGSVKRVQLTNTPIKSPSIKPIPSRKDAHKYGTTVGDSDSDEFEIKPTIFKDENKEVLTPSNDVKRIFSSTEVIPSTTDEKREPGLNHDKIKVSNSDLTKNFNKHHRLTPNSDDIVEHERNKSDDEKLTKPPDIKKVPAINETQNSNLKPNEKIQTKYPQLKQFLKATDDKIPEFVTKIDEIKVIGIEDISFEEGTISNSPVRVDHNIKPAIEATRPVKSQKKKENGVNDEDIKQQEINVNTMENVMKFLNVVADTIAKNTRKGVDSKMKYLHELKYTLLANIKNRIDATWPDDDAARRRARSAAARGHVEFPSSESALMTISFLTFAVFLIKLVLQVIQTYKGKAMMVAPLMVATAGRSNNRKLRTSN